MTQSYFNLMRDYYRKKLNKLLSRIGDEEYIQLLWAANILQTDKPEPARKFFQPNSIPEGAIGAKLLSKHSIHKWEIETLANEIMTIPKQETRVKGPTKILHHDHFGSLIRCVNWLRKLENAEFSVLKKRQSIFLEMGRTVARQFDWQRGYVNLPQFYRNAFVYGHGPCAAYFEQAHGITLNRFSEIGFILFVSFSHGPVVQNDKAWKTLGIEWQEVEKVLALISFPFSKAAELAQKRRREVIHTADKPSILRQSPCLRFGEDGERIRAPLPELILAVCLVWFFFAFIVSIVFVFHALVMVFSRLQLYARVTRFHSSLTFFRLRR